MRGHGLDAATAAPHERGPPKFSTTLATERSELVKERRATRVSEHHQTLSEHYRRMGSASYRSTSSRWGCAADVSMQDRPSLENVPLSESTRAGPSIGTYADITRDRKGRYWDTSKAATLGYRPDATWFRSSQRGNVPEMVRGHPKD